MDLPVRETLDILALKFWLVNCLLNPAMAPKKGDNAKAAKKGNSKDEASGGAKEKKGGNAVKVCPIVHLPRVTIVDLKPIFIIIVTRIFYYNFSYIMR